MAGGHGHGHGPEGEHDGSQNKKIALLIAVLALVLAFSETLGKGAQTGAISYNIEASNLWAFFQAKTIRMTTLRTAAEAAESQLPILGDPKAREAMDKRITDWKKTAARYDSEPETKEGRKELSERAKAAVQIAIVLASAAIITSMTALVWIAGALGIVGVVFCAIGVFAPTAVHLF